MHKRTHDRYGELFFVYRDFFDWGRRAHFAAMTASAGISGSDSLLFEQRRDGAALKTEWDT